MPEHKNLENSSDKRSPGSEATAKPIQKSEARLGERFSHLKLALASASQICILGAGESGLGAALLAKNLGYQVFVSDFGQISEANRKELEANEIEYEQGGHSEARILASDLVIKSPGIPDKAPIVQRIRSLERGADFRGSETSQSAPIPPELIGEIEFAFRHQQQGRTIGITGSNGKTTVTLLIQHFLQMGELDARAGGNLGTSFARLLLEPATEETIYVLELSSFQLDSIKDFRAGQAVLLNITPDHLDRYDYELDKYIDSKLRIFRNQAGGDLAYYYGEDENIAAGMARNPMPAQRRKITLTGNDPDRRKSKKSIQYAGQTYDLGTGKLRGRHNAINATFAAAVATDLGIKPEDIQRGLDSFEPAPHRMEMIGKHEGVTWINDSKATNVDATRYALDAVETPLIWIAGGTDKGNDYDPLKPIVRQRVRALVCLGKENGKLNAAFADEIAEIIETDTVAKAVAEARRLAHDGDTVLLSPACASFDLFRNYVDRGDQFRREVLNLMNTNNA